VLWGLGPRHDTTAQDAADFWLNFRAASCCFIRERLTTSVAFMTFSSRSVTAESETHYRGITALFS